MSARKRKPKKEEKPVIEQEKPWFKFWPQGVHKHIDYPEVPLFEFLRNTAKKHPDQTAIVYFDRKITYKGLDIATDKFATALDALGVKKGDKVALFLPNIPQFVISYYGIIKIGAIETAISPLYKERS
jgi:long-chain acyl-CoA synthetase